MRPFAKILCIDVSVPGKNTLLKTEMKYLREINNKKQHRTIDMIMSSRNAGNQAFQVTNSL